MRTHREAPDYPNNQPPIWWQNWGRISADSGTPVVVGEWGGLWEGGSFQGGDFLPTDAWQTRLAMYMREHTSGFFYWTLNDNSFRTGSLFHDYTGHSAEKLSMLATSPATHIAQLQAIWTPPPPSPPPPIIPFPLHPPPLPSKPSPGLPPVPSPPPPSRPSFPPSKPPSLPPLQPPLPPLLPPLQPPLLPPSSPSMLSNFVGSRLLLVIGVGFLLCMVIACPYVIARMVAKASRSRLLTRRSYQRGSVESDEDDSMSGESDEDDSLSSDKCEEESKEELASEQEQEQEGYQEEREGEEEQEGADKEGVGEQDGEEEQGDADKEGVEGQWEGREEQECAGREGEEGQWEGGGGREGGEECAGAKGATRRVSG